MDGLDVRRACENHSWLPPRCRAETSASMACGKLLSRRRAWPVFTFHHSNRLSKREKKEMHAKAAESLDVEDQAVREREASKRQRERRAGRAIG